MKTKTLGYILLVIITPFMLYLSVCIFDLMEKVIAPVTMWEQVFANAVGVISFFFISIACTEPVFNMIGSDAKMKDQSEQNVPLQKLKCE